MEAGELIDPLTGLLDDVAPAAVTRQIENGAALTGVWAALQESGFLDALVPEDGGGSGLLLSTVGMLMQAVGNRAVPAPVAETMVARALLASAGQDVPVGPIALATIVNGRATAVPMALAAEYLLLDIAGDAMLVRAERIEIAPTGVAGSQAGHVGITPGLAGRPVPLPHGAVQGAAAVVRASLIAGACDRLLQMTVDYANDRIQFGKPVGKLQAIQQQIAVMAELTVAARIAAQIGCSTGLPPVPAAAAVAKQATSAAAVDVANIAHAVHGAIGISEEYDLGLFSRRLHEWRLADGSSSYWAGRIGHDRLAATGLSSVDYARLRMGEEEIA